MTTHQIVYVSVAEPFTQDELEALLTRARLKNQQTGITGMLLHHQNTFLQVLEGPRGAVEGLFDRISLDPRHSRLLLLARRDMPRPSFEGWSMGFVNTAAHDLSGLPGFLDYHKALSLPAGKVETDLVWKILQSFRGGKYRQCVQNGAGGHAPHPMPRGSGPRPMSGIRRL